MTRCWDGLAVSEDAVGDLSGRFRKLAEEAKGQSFDIETVARVGYDSHPQYRRRAKIEPVAPRSWLRPSRSQCPSRLNRSHRQQRQLNPRGSGGGVGYSKASVPPLWQLC